MKTSPSAVEHTAIHVTETSIDEAIEQEAIRRLQSLDPDNCLTHQQLLEHVQKMGARPGQEGEKG
ncbi:hypothetical protein [Chromobacterium sp.]|uniref:hypothetical protein n=1 Tax=Chromobacterium sp. TaxID=306190 RepID=UPI0035B4C8F9